MDESMNDRMLRWFQGDRQAQHFAEMLWSAVQEWDDLEDEGKCENHNELISWWAFGKEYHPFFVQHSHILRPVLLSAYLSWTAANELDKGDKDDVAKSYMLRAAFYNVLHMMAWIVGGDSWATMVGPEIFKSYGESPESLWKEMQDA